MILPRMMLQVILLLAILASGCKGKTRTMTAYANETLRTWNVGRYTLSLPDTSLETNQTQAVEDITLTFEQAPAEDSLTAALQRRDTDLASRAGSPIINRYHWTEDTGGILYVLHMSDPSYYEIEARRWMQGRMLVGVTSADKKDTEAMIADVRQTLDNYQPHFAGGVSFDRFGMRDGSLNQKFRNAEEFDAEFTLPDTGIYLEITSKVVAQPVKIDLFEREADTVSSAKQGGVLINVLRKGRRTAAGQEGWEVVDTGVEHKQHQYDARFEAPGVANSAGQTYLIVHFYTNSRSGKANDEKQFLALWDTILDSLKVAP